MYAQHINLAMAGKNTNNIVEIINTAILQK